jgi:7,8-dihydropterin-6-yl-methyl-4-(beta-D-ribofuranosyl)aminobenzene 5'-phosphate synthase
MPRCSPFTRMVTVNTGFENVHTFVGGLHLTGGLFEPIIPRTTEELARIGPEVVVPGHCTGWKATHELARQLPAAYIRTSVGWARACTSPD